MSETTPQTSERGRLRSRLRTSAAKRTAVALIVLAALIAGFSFLRSGAFSAVLPKSGAAADEIVVAPRAMSFWVDATGTLRASSVRNFSAPPPFGEYWQFQIVSLAPEGGNVKSGDALINWQIVQEMQFESGYRSS